MKTGLKLILPLTVILVVSVQVASVCVAPDGVSEGEVRSKLAEAFKAVAEAEEAGGEISQLVEELDQAVRMLDEGRLEEAQSKIKAVIAATPRVKQEGIASTKYGTWTAVATIILIAASAVMVWIFGRRIFWQLWLRLKRDWRAGS